MRKHRIYWLVGIPVLALALIVSAVAVAMARRAPEKVEQATVGGVAVEVATIGHRDFPLEEDAPGTVVALQHADLAPKVMGRVAAVYVREGDHVLKGQVLARLESADLKASVSSADAGVQNAVAARAQAETALVMQRKQSAVAEEQARAALAQAQAQLAKAKQGPRPEQVTQADEAEARAKAGLEQAEAGLALVKEGARAQQKRQADQAVLAAEQQVAQAEAGLATAQASQSTVEVDHTRMRNLYAQDIIPKQRLDQVALQLESARQAVRQAEASVKQAKAGAQMAREQASTVYAGARTQEVTAAEKQVEQARSGYEQAKQDAIMAHQGGRWEDVKTAEEAVRQAESGLRAAQAARARDDVMAKDVNRADAGIAQAKAGLSGARTMESYATLVAPFSGIVTARKADPGAMAMPQMALISLDDDSVYQMVSSVPERLAGTLKRGQTVRVRLDALKTTADATIAEVVPSADPASRTLTVKASLPRLAGVQTGLFGRMTITTGTASLLTIASSAIIEQNGLTRVYVVNDAGLARSILVTVGRRFSDRVEVLSGLQDNQKVIVSEADKVVAGSPVQIGGAR